MMRMASSPSRAATLVARNSSSIGRMELPFVALAPQIGANVRVGLEDNLYLSRGQLATNGELVARAVEILERMNVRVLGPEEVREKLALRVGVH